MKLLFVAETLSYGGAARRFVGLANAMAKRNHQVEMLIYGDLIDIKNTINSEILVRNDVVDFEPKNWFERNLFYRIKSIKKINNFLQDKYFDVVISFNDMVNINLLLSQAKSKSKVVISERSDPNYNTRYLQMIKKILFKRADGIVFQTEGAKKFFKRRLPQNTKIIPNPIPENITFNRYKGKRKKRIVSVARLWLYQKRQDVLLKAFKSFLSIHSNYELVLYGDGPDFNKINEIVKKLEIEDNVVLAGAQKNVLDLILDAELFVLSSDFEGIPNALIEAMAMGLPVISTDCSPGGAAFLINHMENGMLVEKGSPSKLYEAMKFMIENPLTAKKLGDNATNIINELNENKIYNQWEQFIYEVQANDYLYE